MFGKLTLSAIPYDQPIIMAAGAFMAIFALVVLGYITYAKKWTYLWKEWFTTVDHKKIGVMYIIAAGIMLLRGFSDAALMRSQQAIAVGANHGYLPPEHYNQIFTAHGVIMIFFMAMPFMFGLFNLAVPLQIGARDVAFPFLNSLSFWLFAVGAVLINLSLVLGKFAATGWLAYPPLSELRFSPGVGVDYYIWSLQISGVGSLLSGINFFVTILKMRCPGMTLMRMPVFTWSVLASSILIIIVFPVLAVTLGLLSFDRLLGMHFFTAAFGGNAMMYVNLIWAWGHPEVYILVLPAFGIFSEVVATFSQKKLFGYTTMVWAIMVITILSFIVWLHHFFTMGAGPDVNAFFGIATMVIAVPTGVKVFNWLFTMYQGRVIYTTPMLWTIGFLITFTVGGMTGVLMSVPAADFQLHNSLFLIAHFHNTIIGGVVFGYFAGLTYWFPKIFGFKLNEKLGKCAFWCWLIGFYVAFVPVYILGFMGMTRRLNHYDAATGWHPYLVVAAMGAFIIFIGVCFQIAQLVVSIIKREEYRDTTGDPWNGRTLEWAIPSPAPFYNFAIVPHVDDIDAFWKMKQEKRVVDKESYDDIHMPRNSALPIIISAFAFALGFGLIWQIIWMIVVGLVGIIGCVLARSFDYDIDYYVMSDEVAETEAHYSTN
ncbi:MAG: cytochrome o ubiquinol oxidase subunit I [Gammaproteobacteria bacterium]